MQLLAAKSAKSPHKRRESITPHGVDAESLAALTVHDETFFGDSLEGISSESESESDTEPQEKRWDEGSESERSDDTDEELDRDVLNESFTNLEDIDTGDAERGLIDADIRDWQSDGCTCKNKNCFVLLDADKLGALVLSIKRLSKRQKKSLVLGELLASVRETSARAKKRDFTYSFNVLGVSVCKAVFMSVNGIGEHVYRNLQDLAESGTAELPSHQGIGRAPGNILKPELVENVVAFIKNTASIFGLPQPAAPRGRAQTPPVYLPATHRKRQVYTEYMEAVGEDSESAVPYTTFCRLWRVHAKDVIVMKPRTDVCAICERHRESIKRARNEEEFATASRALAMHLETARDERQYYIDAIAAAKEDDTVSHLTFDFAQQLELPAHTRQVGPLYFKVRFRLQLFGICEEAKCVQSNYLFHEGQSIGQDGAKAHGPNAVISMLDHYIATNCSGQRNFSLHADNCVGQNKNKSVLAYLAWRIISGWCDSIELNFMRVGHTRCAVDGYFGLLKQKVRSTDIDTVEQACSAVDGSCKANKAQAFDWQWREWDTHLSTFFKPVKGIRKYQHFRLSSEEPGVVHAREDCFGAEDDIRLLKPGVEPSAVPKEKPKVLQPAGISPARVQYLNKHIAEFMADDVAPAGMLHSMLAEHCSVAPSTSIT